MLVKIKGYVDKDGKLNFELPEALEPGEVTITIEGEGEGETLPDFEAKTGAEIIASGVVGAWAHKNIEDSQAWLDELRLREEEKRK
jgi:hypothetical protein